jgi:recombinase
MCTCAAERTAKTKAFSTRLQTSAEMRRRAVPRWTSRPLGEPLWGRRKGVPLRQDWGPAPGEGAAGVQIPAIRLHRGSGSRLMPCPAEQAVMAEIFVLTTAGRSPRGIAQQLAERGIMVPGGRPFAAQTLAQLRRRDGVASCGVSCASRTWLCSSRPAVKLAAPVTASPGRGAPSSHSLASHGSNCWGHSSSDFSRRRQSPYSMSGRYGLC